MSHRPQIQSAPLVHLQAEFKQSLETKVSNKNSLTTYLCASRHLLLYCESVQCNDVCLIPSIVADWEKSLTHQLRTYKTHIRNHFLPFVEALIRHNLQPKTAPVAEPKKRTKSCCPNCNKEMLKKNINRHLKLCQPVM